MATGHVESFAGVSELEYHQLSITGKEALAVAGENQPAVFFLLSQKCSLLVRRGLVFHTNLGRFFKGGSTLCSHFSASRTFEVTLFSARPLLGILKNSSQVI